MTIHYSNETHLSERVRVGLWWLHRVQQYFSYNVAVSLVEEIGIPGENHRLIASHWQTLWHNVVSSTPGMSGIRTYLSESETSYNSRTCLVDIFFKYFIECILTKGRYTYLKQL